MPMAKPSAFPIVDDILDVTATDDMGNRTGKDANIGTTYPSLLGMEASRKHLAQQVQITDQAWTILASARITRRAFMMANRTN